MKRLKKIFSLILIMGVVLILNNTKSVAAEVQYSENVIPKMTSDSAPSGLASASSKQTDSVDTYPAWQAFDQDTTTNYNGWASANGDTNCWLEYDFSESKCITKYTLKYRNIETNYTTLHLQQLPKSWTFEAWDEKLNEWVVKDTQTNITNWSITKKEFTFTNTSSYKKYRINILENNGYKFTSIGELEMMETVKAPSSLKVVLGVGESLQLSVNNNLDVNAKMNWTSDDTSIATVDANGIATGVKSGSTVITVTNADGSYKETINLLVINDETDLQLAIDLRVGDTRRLTVDDLTDTVVATWASNSNAVATVSDKGKVTAVSVGTTYVTVTDDQSNEIGKILVRVRK